MGWSAWSLLAVALVAGSTLAAEGRTGRGWPDGCVDRIEGDVVVLVTPGGTEVEIALRGRRPPDEGACFARGRLSSRVTAAERERAARLIEALTRASQKGETAQECMDSQRIISLTSEDVCP